MRNVQIIGVFSSKQQCPDDREGVTCRQAFAGAGQLASNLGILFGLRQGNQLRLNPRRYFSLVAQQSYRPVTDVLIGMVERFRSKSLTEATTDVECPECLQSLLPAALPNDLVKPGNNGLVSAIRQNPPRLFPKPLVLVRQVTDELFAAQLPEVKRFDRHRSLSLESIDSPACLVPVVLRAQMTEANIVPVCDVNRPVRSELDVYRPEPAVVGEYDRLGIDGLEC